MRMNKFAIIFIFFCAINAAAYAADKVLPSKFIGSFKLENSENFDEYMIAKGVGWVTRQLVKVASFRKVFKMAKSGTPGRYDLENLTSKKDIFYYDWQLGKQFQDESLDGIQRYITFDIDESANILTEKHITVDNPDDVEVYEYLVDGNKMTMNLSYNGVQARRFYIRE